MSCSNDTRTFQTDSKLYKDPLTSNTGSGKVRQKFRFCFKFSAFVFSHVGLGFLVLVYTVMGAFIFKHFEESSMPLKNSEIADIRNNTVHKLWSETYKLNVLYKENWTVMAIKEIEHFQRELIKAIKNGHTPDVGDDGHQQSTRWSFTDSWMYSISIITTIGYANRPTTAEGKIATMLYALFGIPIMLLFLSTLGNLLGRGLKFLYNFCCTCSNNSPSSLINLNSSHDHHHHLHEDYQVHHIALNNINSSNRHLLACNPSTLANNAYPINKNYSTYNPHCSCELEAETKLCVDPMDRLCSDKLTTMPGHSHNCTFINEIEPSLFYKDNFAKAHSHPSLPASVYEEGPRENVPFYFCFFLMMLYILWGAFMFYLWEGWSFLDGAYFSFVTLSTIGFGDLIPEKTLSMNQTESKKRIILVVLYILGGMTLIAMSFNIIYEQLAYKFRNLGSKFHLHRESTRAPNGRDIKIVTNKFVNVAEDIDV